MYVSGLGRGAFLRGLLSIAWCYVTIGWFAADLAAQTASVRGFVTDESDRQPLQGVNVVLRGEDGAFLGAATDADGFYAISRIPSGRYAMRASFTGYVPFTDTLHLSAGELLTLNFRLGPDEGELDEIVVEGEREGAGAARVTAGLQRVRPTDIELVPAPDVSGDLVNYLVTMPGVVAPGDRGGQLFIRGGEPSQNLVLLDGMLVYQPFHLIGFYSAFPSDIISNSDVYAGGFGGRYGGRLSSVIDVASRNGSKRSPAASVSVAPFVSAARIEGPLWRDKVSVLASWRQSVIEQAASRLVDQPLPFRFNDQFAKIHANLGPSSQASISAIRTYDRGTIGTPEASEVAAESDQVIWRNEALGGRFLVLPAALPVLAEVLLSTSYVWNGFGPEDAPTRSSSAQQFNAGANVTHYTNLVDFTWGLNVRSSILDSKLGGQFQDLETDREYVTEAALYVEPEIKVGTRLRFRPALRLQSFSSKSRTFLEPRVRATWDGGRHRVSGAWGIYHQEIVGLADRRDAGDVFTAWTTSPLGHVPAAMHFIAGYNVSATRWLDLSLESFYKRLSNLFVAEWTAFPRFTTRLQPAAGEVAGLDLRAEVSRGPFYGLISYGLSSVAYEAQGRVIVHWYGEQEKRFHPPHDRRHQVNAMGSLELYGFDLSVRWQFGSGLPFTEALGFDTFVLLEGPTDVTREPGAERVLYGQPYEGRLPTYHRLDVSAERSFNPLRKVRATIQASLINTYDRMNLFYVDLYTLRRVDQLPLIPSVGLRIEVG